jgi:3-oxoacyl-[acyl-carrier protein] reductase
VTPRTALITGASRGIGLACAHSLSAAGHTVVLAARNEDLLKQAADGINAAGGKAYYVTMDLGVGASIKEGFEKAVALAGPIQILVNNGGLTRDTLAMRMKAEDWDAVITTNLTGAFLCIQQVLRGMMKAEWGRIINIASVVGESGNVGQANYVSSKAGLIGLTKAIALEMASRNITANAIAPGFIATDMTAVLSEEVRSAMMQRIPLKRFGQADDIAAAVRFLASEEAGYITGHTLDVNGGMYM